MLIRERAPDGIESSWSRANVSPPRSWAPFLAPTGASAIKAEQIKGYRITRGGEIGSL